MKNISDEKNVTANGSPRASMELWVHNIHHILSHIPPVEALDKKSEYEMWNGSGIFIKEGNHKKHAEVLKAEDKKRKTKNNGDSVSYAANVTKKMNLKFTKAWISFLSLPLPLDVYKELLDSCLKSPLLPAHLAAAFAKKLSRLALSVPPSGALIIIALIHNLLRRHPSINCLVHREDGNGTAEDDLRAKKVDVHVEDDSTSMDMSSKRPGIDHFNNGENDPVKTNAMNAY